MFSCQLSARADERSTQEVGVQAREFSPKTRTATAESAHHYSGVFLVIYRFQFIAVRADVTTANREPPTA